jgi:two-component system LytT family response regulator
MTLRAVIVDDDKTNIKLVRNLIDRYSNDIQVVGEATNLLDAVEILGKLKPDLVFLDIELHNKTGFDVLDLVRQESLHVVIISAHEQYAIKAFKYETVDYLLKPIEIEEFVRMLHSVKKRIQGVASVPKTEREFLAVPTKTYIELVAFKQIIYLESENSYTKIFTVSNQKLLSSRSLKENELELPKSDFYRVHHSFIVNVHCITGYTKGKSATLFLSNGAEIPISPTRRNEVLTALNFE